MKKLFASLLLFAFCLGAADFWQSKPAAEWSDKDLQKMMNNSPWARPFSVSMSGPAPPTLGRGAGNSPADDTAAPAPISEGGGGGRGGRGGGGAATSGAGGPAPVADASMTVVARWQSALPVKQAFARLGNGSAPEHEETSYVIVLSGPLRPFLRGDAEALKKAIVGMSSLAAKGKDALRPAELQIGSNQKAIEMLFAFPRSAPFTLDDKEVEFSTKVGDLALKYKFRLKDMVYNGKLEL
jgi:hypothetical protein